MIKLIGCLTLATGFFLVGMYKSKELFIRKREIEKIVRLIGEIEVLTDFNNLSVREIFSLIEQQSKSDYPQTVYKFNQLIKAEEQPSAFKKSVNDTCDGLNSDDKKLFYEFLSSLGKTDCELQIQSCKKYLHTFEIRLAEAESKYSANGSLYKKLGVLSALMTVVVII